MQSHHECLKVTFSVDGEVLKTTRRRAEAMGATVNELIREYRDEIHESR
jgi:hypothetical protein